MNTNRIRSRKGFTLTELIIVMVIIAILAVILVPHLFAYLEKAHESNDLRAASNILRASILAVTDQKNQIPPNHYLEVLWITGSESTTVESGMLMIRYTHSGSRISIFNDSDPEYNIPSLSPSDIEGDADAVLEKIAETLFNVMGVEYEAFSNTSIGTGYMGNIGDADSELGNTANLSFHINTTTGQVALARLRSEPKDKINRWVELGLDIEPAP